MGPKKRDAAQLQNQQEMSVAYLGQSFKSKADFHTYFSTVLRYVIPLQE